MYSSQNEANDLEFSSPQKKQKKETILSVNIHSFDIDVITAQDFYVKEKKKEY